MMREMKDSGIEWIGEIPKEWEIKRIKAVLNERNESNNPVKTDFILSLTNDRGVIPYTEKGDVGNKSKDDLAGYKLAYQNDIVLNSMNVIIGSVALSAYYGCVSPVYYMLYPRNIEDCVRYYNYLFQTKELQNKLIGYGNGIMEIRMRIQMSKLNTVDFPIPPPEHQHRIADYLDDKCAKIDAIIAREQAVIGKLKAYKLSVITEAVTKGLNPDVPMKDSGIEWIGEIPEHWTVAKIKYGTLKVGSGKTPKGGSEIYSDQGILFIRSQNVYDEGLRIDDATYISDEIDNEMKNTRVFENDILLNITGGSIGRACIYPSGLHYANVNQHVCIIRVKKEVFIPLYMRYLWNSWIGHTSIDIFQSGANREGMNFEQIKNSFMPLANINEQDEICRYLDAKCAKIDSAIDKKQAVIDKLTEYKKSLIYEVVTGKKEV